MADSFEETVARMIVSDEMGRAEMVAEAMGPPALSTRVSDEKELELWNLAVPGVDPAALVQQGLSPADATLKKYPYRKDLILRGHPTINDQVKYAEMMARRSRQRQEGAVNVYAASGVSENTSAYNP